MSAFKTLLTTLVCGLGVSNTLGQSLAPVPVHARTHDSSDTAQRPPERQTIAIAVTEAGSAVCGGIAWIPCDNPNDFCKLPIGGCCCDFQGVCTPKGDGVCPDVWDPVCGCNGITYGNECEADAAGVSIDHRGACGAVCGGIAGIPCDNPNDFCKLPIGGCCCDFQGVCTPKGDGVCPAVWDPVCGCDGITYGNECEADAAGISVDHVGECTQTCPTAAALRPDPTGIAKNRYLTFAVDTPGRRTAVRVLPLSAFVPPAVSSGAARWVTAPTWVSENSGLVGETIGSPMIQVATLSCTPIFLDWSAYGPVHVYHRSILPGNAYVMQTIDEACPSGDERYFSAPLEVRTSAWGDVAGPFDPTTGTFSAPDGGVDVAIDVVALVDKFANRPGAPSKARADLEPATPDLKINITDLAVALDAFRGGAYPFDVTVDPCP